MITTLTSQRNLSGDGLAQRVAQRQCYAVATADSELKQIITAPSGCQAIMEPLSSYLCKVKFPGLHLTDFICCQFTGHAVAGIIIFLTYLLCCGLSQDTHFHMLEKKKFLKRKGLGGLIKEAIERQCYVEERATSIMPEQTWL